MSPLMWDQENVGLEEEVLTVKLQLTEAQSSVTRLQKDLDQLFSDKVTAHHSTNFID